MGKISPVSIKYMIYANFEASGTLEKPDVIGAIFGQTEGLLGSDLEMRDLQKEGKIGRIEVELENKNGKTVGRIEIPSALDKTETTLIAAAIETIERIGPSTSKIKVEKIEDVRENKRNYILNRAKELLENIEEKMPKTREIASNLKKEARESKLQEYGKEKLPAGNLNGKEIIVVEGRADVLNLLRNHVDNVIGMNGTMLPETIKELSEEKEMTLFVDGDRGGKLIAKNVINNANIKYVAFAPDGKEVEELSGKEILASLRKKIPSEEFLKQSKFIRGIRNEKKETKFRENVKETKKQEEWDNKKFEKNKEKLSNYIEEIENKRLALVLNENLEITGKTSIKNLPILARKRRVYAIMVSKATPNIIKTAERLGIKNVIARNFAISSNIINLVSL